MGFFTMVAADAAGGALSGVSDAVTLFSKVWEIISANPILMVFIGVALLSAGVGLFSRLFNTTRGVS